MCQLLRGFPGFPMPRSATPGSRLPSAGASFCRRPTQSERASHDQRRTCAGVNNVHHLGHGHPRLIAAIKAQLAELPITPRRFTNQPAVALARTLAEIAPANLDKVLLAPGGSEAIEMALKLARAVTGRHKTISFWDSFDGAGFGAVSVGGEALFRSGPTGPPLAGTGHVAPFTCYRCPYMAIRTAAASRTQGNVLTPTPPLITTEADIDRALAIIDAALLETEGASRAAGLELPFGHPRVCGGRLASYS